MIVSTMVSVSVSITDTVSPNGRDEVGPRAVVVSAR